MKNHPDYLRHPDKASSPDLRNLGYEIYDENKGYRPFELRDYFDSASKLTLNDKVPKDIIIQFETVKNLYIYSWFVYRFYPVSEHQALVCLEFALRERFEHEILARRSKNNKRKTTLAPLLRHAIKEGHIRNEGFRLWHEASRVRAESRHVLEKLKEMSELDLDEMPFNYDDAEVKDEDRNWEYINILQKNLPYIRNNYAHGSKTLYREIFSTLQTVSEIINQIF